jgi:hypothetical protein
LKILPLVLSIRILLAVNCVGVPEGRKVVGRCRHKWMNNIKTDDKKLMGGCGLSSIGSGQDQAASSCE